MTRYIFAAAFLILSTAALRAQTPQTPAKMDCFAPVETEYQFGKVDGGVPVKHTFVFKNTCKTVVEIDQVKASCGCTAAVVSEKVIQPGRVAKIDVTFTPPTGSRGTVSKTVSVYLKGSTDVHTLLRFSADVKTYYDLEPRSFQLQNATVGTPLVSRVAMKNTGEKDLDVRDMILSLTSYKDTVIAGSKSNVSSTLPGQLRSPAAFILKPGESRVLEISLTPEHPGQILGSLRVSTFAGEESIPVTGKVQQPFLRR